MKPLRSIFLLSLLVLPFSCTKPQENGGGGSETEDNYPNSFYMKASFEQGEGIDFPTHWEDSDVFYAYDCTDGTLAGKTGIESGQGKNTALNLVSTKLEAGSRVRLLSASGQNILHPLELQQNQVQAAEGRPFWEHCFAYTDELTLSEGALTNSEVHFPTAILRVVLDAGNDSETLSGQLEQASFSCTGETLGGTFRINWETGGTEAVSGLDRVSAVLPDGMKIKEGDNIAWICALPCNLSGKTCSLELDFRLPGGNSISQTSKFKGRELKAGTVYTLRVRPQDELVSKGNPSLEEYSYTAIPTKSSMTGSWSTSQSSKTVVLDGMNRMDKYNASTLDSWGGYRGVKPDAVTSSNPAGFWRTGKYKGHNVMVNPEGNVTILHGINGLNPDMLRAQSQPESLNEYNARFSNVTQWAQWANGFLNDYGFNFFETGPQRIRNQRSTITSEIEDILQGKGTGSNKSQVAFICFLRTFSWDYYSISGTSGPTTTGKDISVFTLMFDPDWPDYVNKLAYDATSLYKDNPNFIGYYTDNELQFRFADGKSGIFLNKWINLEGPARCYPYAKAYAEKFIRDKYGVEPLAENITSEMESAFLLDIARYYYKTVTDAVRKYDKNHLLLGSRLHGAPMWKDEVTRACAEYNDVISTNIYGVWEPQENYYVDHVKRIAGDKPCMITEFYTRNANQTFKGTPYANSGEGGGWMVQSQKERGLYYQNFTRKAISLDNIVGWQWFQAMDDFLIGYGWNNKGLAAPDFKYYDCIDYFRRQHWNIYQILDYYCGASSPATPDFENIIWE